MEGAPTGAVRVQARAVQDGVLLTGQGAASVAADQTVAVTIDLEAPSDLFRRVRVEGWMHVIDHDRDRGPEVGDR